MCQFCWSYKFYLRVTHNLSKLDAWTDMIYVPEGFEGIDWKTCLRFFAIGIRCGLQLNWRIKKSINACYSIQCLRNQASSPIWRFCVAEEEQDTCCAFVESVFTHLCLSLPNRFHWTTALPFVLKHWHTRPGIWVQTWRDAADSSSSNSSYPSYDCSSVPVTPSLSHLHPQRSRDRI